MNFKINKDKLEKTFFKYLDKKNLSIIETRYNFFFVKNKTDEYSLIKVRKGVKHCLVYDGLFDELKFFFSLSDKDTRDFLVKYVENKVNINIEEFQSYYAIDSLGLYID